MDLINIKNLFFKYQKTEVLENVNLTIKDDDFLAIIGPNGGGKSTLLKLILGLLPLQSGTIEKNIENNQVGYVPQNTNLNIDFPITALEVVLMGHISSKKRLFGYSKDEISCAIESLNQVGMKDFANKKIGDLSGGQRQRVFIARALCSNPKIMLLDEPTNALDEDSENRILDILSKIDKSMIIVSHHKSFIEKIVSKIYNLSSL